MKLKDALLLLLLILLLWSYAKKAKELRPAKGSNAYIIFKTIN